MLSSLFQPCDVKIHLLQNAIFLHPPERAQPAASDDAAAPPSGNDELIRGLVELWVPSDRHIAGIKVKLRAMQTIAVLDSATLSTPVTWEDSVVLQRTLYIGTSPATSGTGAGKEHGSGKEAEGKGKGKQRSKSRQSSPSRSPTHAFSNGHSHAHGHGHGGGNGSSSSSNTTPNAASPMASGSGSGNGSISSSTSYFPMTTLPAAYEGGTLTPPREQPGSAGPSRPPSPGAAAAEDGSASRGRRRSSKDPHGHHNHNHGHHHHHKENHGGLAGAIAAAMARGRSASRKPGSNSASANASGYASVRTLSPAQSRATSRANSRSRLGGGAGSRTGSRAGSRAPSPEPSPHSHSHAHLDGGGLGSGRAETRSPLPPAHSPSPLASPAPPPPAALNEPTSSGSAGALAEHQQGQQIKREASPLPADEYEVSEVVAKGADDVAPHANGNGNGHGHGTATDEAQGQQHQQQQRIHFADMPDATRQTSAATSASGSGAGSVAGTAHGSATSRATGRGGIGNQNGHSSTASAQGHGQSSDIAEAARRLSLVNASPTKHEGEMTTAPSTGSSTVFEHGSGMADSPTSSTGLARQQAAPPASAGVASAGRGGFGNIRRASVDLSGPGAAGGILNATTSSSSALPHAAATAQHEERRTGRSGFLMLGRGGLGATSSAGNAFAHANAGNASAASSNGALSLGSSGSSQSRSASVALPLPKIMGGTGKKERGASRGRGAREHSVAGHGRVPYDPASSNGAAANGAGHGSGSSVRSESTHSTLDAEGTGLTLSKGVHG